MDKVASDAKTSSQDIDEAIREVVNNMDSEDAMQWTQAGLPSLGWVKSQLSPAAADAVTRKVLDNIGVVRDEQTQD